MMPTTVVARRSGSWRTVSVSLITAAPDGLGAERGDSLDVGTHRNLALLRVRFDQSRRRLVVDDDVFADVFAGTAEERIDVIGGRHAVGLAWLRHHVADVNLHRVRVCDFLRDTRDEKVRQNRGEERPGTEHDGVGVANRGDDFLERFGAARFEEDTLDRFFRLGNVRFAVYDRPSSSSAQSRTMPSVAGNTRPTILSTRLDSLMARSKLPVTPLIAARKRFPKECPLRPSPSVKRKRKRSVTNASSSASATKQFECRREAERRVPSEGGRRTRRRRSPSRRR